MFVRLFVAYTWAFHLDDEEPALRSPSCWRHRHRRVPVVANSQADAASQADSNRSIPNTDFGMYAAAPHSAARGAYSASS